MKKLIALLLAVVMVFALAACGGSGKSDTITINIGHSDTTQNLIHISLEHFAAAVK